MALTVSYSETRFIQKIFFDWVSDAAGVCTGNSKKLSGRIARVTFVPSGTATPTNNYKLKLLDEDSFDVLMGYGEAGLSDTNTTAVIPRIGDAVGGVPSYPVVIDGKLTVNVSNAGNAKAGRVTLYLER